MNLGDYFDKENLHHAYLIEGVREEIVPTIKSFLESIGIKTTGNSDFIHIHQDSFKIDDARNLKAFASQKSFSTEKRIFIITANNFLLEAQNTLLKMFEEPIQNTHFFLIVPDTNALLKTLVSRFYLIPSMSHVEEEAKKAEEFIAMSLPARIDFIKELLTENDEEDEEGNEIISSDSARSKAIKFLNALELTLHRNSLENFEWRKSHPVIGEGSRRHNFPENCFAHFFKVREFLRMPGSSSKSLMESVALITPSL
ncbi:MAG: hypothetical protein WAV15_04400 [Minisyncoccia bacterium]